VGEDPRILKNLEIEGGKIPKIHGRFMYCIYMNQEDNKQKNILSKYIDYY
jgi:hypothetical protein